LLLTHTAPAQIYTLSLHDALPIFQLAVVAATEETTAAPVALAGSGSAVLTVTAAIDESIAAPVHLRPGGAVGLTAAASTEEASADRKSTRLNSSHVKISYAVFCLQ